MLQRWLLRKMLLPHATVLRTRSPVIPNTGRAKQTLGGLVTHAPSSEGQNNTQHGAMQPIIKGLSRNLSEELPPAKIRQFGSLLGRAPHAMSEDRRGSVLR
jgi:hypothetical protein